MTDLTRARELAASVYPEENYVKRGDRLVGYPNVVRAAILAGRYDDGEIVKRHMREQGHVQQA